ncbi:YihY/virulence factor BrkB family protein [Porphyromonas levii]|uniref:YihY/virulence factor BrkB family protein n=1 Tax=Porphyromonas levii TaxID=28114 RepID=UPI001B8CFEA2|nr:YihY/virulence factor BrkB family protein [Porphyromonas levii]MBR8704174.1 hypothetical protein [Porphyromonas levii]MBR8714102.1 hypothetical protein [Porphyromonas levii]MBR8716093.1 hypothetical protein [Porphyromonas levii]MBR8728627.1 hypothetical protein [Porphyromonas levii]MBR8732113.1 hypothetical protein [Porphyromonas levii]
MEDNKREEYHRRIEEIQSRRNKEGEKKNPFFKRVFDWFGNAYQFVTSDMWRLYDQEMTGVSGFFVRVLRVLYVSIKEFIEGRVAQKSSALTYTTLLALVPTLTLILSVGAGFGMQASVQRALYDAFPAHQMELTTAFDLVEAYLNEIHSGVLIIVGLIVLIYTVFSMLLTVESVFNQIWQIKVGRPISKSLIGYLAAIVIVPVALIAISFSNIFISSLSSIELLGTISIAPVITTLLKILPVVIIILILTAFYITMPNTQVRIVPALIAGVVAGFAFQFFQMFYISGQLWVSKYNSIYGSIAAIPLLMLFVQFSWTIILFGAQLSYAIQNVKRYVFRNESEKVSRRYRDLVAVILMKKVCMAFRYQGLPYTADQLSEETDLPIIIVQDTLDKLVACRLLSANEPSSRRHALTYTPASEISSITVKRVLTALDRLGSENFRMDIYDEYAEEWDVIRIARQLPFEELEIPVVEIDSHREK